MDHLLTIVALCAGFSSLDLALTGLGVQGVYYAIHALHNACIVYCSFHEVVQTITDFNSIHTTPPNMRVLELCFALHFYHIALYFRKLRFDDWLHHGLMIGVALPIGGLVPSGTLLGYSLFFLTGLPGGIDYAGLFLVRNGWMTKQTQKYINMNLATWIRAPGCVSVATYIVATTSVHAPPWQYALGAYLVAALNFWNGQYFLQQVVYDAGAQGVTAPTDQTPRIGSIATLARR
jgi:hypothetical protein